MYCIAFTEPEHGSDLAAVETLGDVIGDEVFLTGTKVWLHHADRADAALVLCRTEPAAQRYHNLSCVLVPLHDNNVQLRPLRQISGSDDYFEAVFDGARAPLTNIVGGRGNGCRVAMETLACARSSPGTFDPVDVEREYWDLVETARGYGRDRNPLIRQRLAQAYARMRILQLHHQRASSLTNLLWSDYRRSLGEIAMDIMGPDALIRPDSETYATSHWQHVLLSGQAESVANGTGDLQRTTIGEHLLGLPK